MGIQKSRAPLSTFGTGGREGGEQPSYFGVRLVFTALMEAAYEQVCWYRGRAGGGTAVDLSGRARWDRVTRLGRWALDARPRSSFKGCQ